MEEDENKDDNFLKNDEDKNILEPSHFLNLFHKEKTRRSHSSPLPHLVAHQNPRQSERTASQNPPGSLIRTVYYIHILYIYSYTETTYIYINIYL